MHVTRVEVTVRTYDTAHSVIAPIDDVTANSPPSTDDTGVLEQLAACLHQIDLARPELGLHRAVDALDRYVT